MTLSFLLAKVCGAVTLASTFQQDCQHQGYLVLQYPLH